MYSAPATIAKATRKETATMPKRTANAIITFWDGEATIMVKNAKMTGIRLMATSSIPSLFGLMLLFCASNVWLGQKYAATHVLKGEAGMAETMPVASGFPFIGKTDELFAFALAFSIISLYVTISASLPCFAASFTSIAILSPQLMLLP